MSFVELMYCINHKLKECMDLLKKYFAFFLILTVMLSLFGCSIDNEEKELEGVEKGSEHLQEDLEEKNEDELGSTNNGLHLNVFFENGTSAEMVHIPSFRFELYDNYREGTMLAAIDVNEEHYHDGIYSLVFDIPKFELGQKFDILFKTNDELIDVAVFNDVNYHESGRYTVLKDNQFAKFEIETVKLRNEEEVLSGVKEAPLTSYIEVHEKLVLVLEDNKGNPIPNQEIEVKWPSSGKVDKGVSNGSGVVVLDIREKGGSFSVEPLGTNYTLTDNATRKLPSLEGYGLKTIVNYEVQGNKLLVHLREPGFMLTDTEFMYWGYLSYIIILDDM